MIPSIDGQGRGQRKLLVAAAATIAQQSYGGFTSAEHTRRGFNRIVRVENFFGNGRIKLGHFTGLTLHFGRKN